MLNSKLVTKVGKQRWRTVRLLLESFYVLWTLVLIERQFRLIQKFLQQVVDCKKFPLLEVRELTKFRLLKQYCLLCKTDFVVYIVVQYPERHNLMIPPDLMQELDLMEPQQFLNVVMNSDKLNIMQRESIMANECQRRRTFLSSWPHRNNLSGIRMAQAGLYSVGNGDEVQCVFCRGRLRKWETNDDPMQEHSRLYPFCRFVKGLSCGNQPYRQTITSEDFRNLTSFRPGWTTLAKADINRACRLTGVNNIRPDRIEYALESSRKVTFKRWFYEARVPAKQLWLAGFYATGAGDEVRCFYCAGGFRDWSRGDDPWEFHARYFSTCPFLMQMKRQDWIKRVRDQTPAERKGPISDADYMVEIAGKLDHQPQTINRAIANNGGPFQDVKDLIEALYKLEEAEESEDSEDTEAVRNTRIPLQDNEINSTDNLVEVPSNINSGSNLSQTVQTDDSSPGATNSQTQSSQQESAVDSLSDGLCKVCKAEPANQIALPCGHLVFCSSCNEQNRQSNADKGYQPQCPNCLADVTETFRVYYA